MVLLAPVAGTAYLVYLDRQRHRRALSRTSCARSCSAIRCRASASSACWCSRSSSASSRTTSSGAGWSRFFDRSFQRVPLFGGTYGLIKQVFESVFAQGADSFNRAVLVEYPRPGIFAIAFVTASDVPVRSERRRGAAQRLRPDDAEPDVGLLSPRREEAGARARHAGAAGVQAGHHHGHRKRARAAYDDSKVAAQGFGGQVVIQATLDLPEIGPASDFRKTRHAGFRGVGRRRGGNATCVGRGPCVRSMRRV